MKAHVKDFAVSVLFADEDERDLSRLVEIERRRRKNVRFGAATLVRELVMPKVREMLAEQSQAAA